MCGFVGFSSFSSNITQKDKIIKDMNNELSKRGPDEEGYYIENNVCLGHKRLIVIDPKGRKTTNDKKIFFWRIHNCI